MLEKRPWSKLTLLTLSLVTCTLLWRQMSDTTYIAPVPPPTVVYTLYDNDDAHHRHIFDALASLSDADYSRLIDFRNFSFTTINYVCAAGGGGGTGNETAPPILLLILVHSSPNNFAKRATIRSTWGAKIDNRVKIVFMLGATEVSETRERLEAENRRYRDFAQGNFFDAYRNLTYKHVMALKYFAYHCPYAKYVLKTDDDVFVNIKTLKNFLEFDLSPYGASGGLFCTTRRNNLVLRSYRSKWRVSFDEFPDRVYPTYCPGWTILYTPDVAVGLYKEAQKTKYFWIDDVHLTGTLFGKLNFTHTDIESFILSKSVINKMVRSDSYNYTQPFLYGREDLVEKQIRGLWRYVETREAPKFILRKNFP